MTLSRLALSTIRRALIAVMVVMAGAVGVSADNHDQWAYSAGKQSRAATLSFFWYNYNDLGTFEADRTGALTVRSDEEALSVTLDLGEGAICSQTRVLVPIEMTFDDGPVQRTVWRVLEDRRRVEAEAPAAMIEALLAHQAIWMEADDGCGWPWRAEIWIEEGHKPIRRVTASW